MKISMLLFDFDNEISRKIENTPEVSVYIVLRKGLRFFCRGRSSFVKKITFRANKIKGVKVLVFRINGGGRSRTSL